MATAIPQPGLDRDAVKVDPKHYKVELENDHVRVVRIRYAGRDKSVMHQHPPGLAIFLTDVTAKFTYPDGKSEEIQGKAGEYMWFGEAWEHLPENSTDNPFEALYVEVKA